MSGAAQLTFCMNVACKTVQLHLANNTVLMILLVLLQCPNDIE